jgi:hypothetical protein
MHFDFNNQFIKVVATQFLTRIFDKFTEKPKNSKKTKKTPKNTFLIYLHRF